MKNATSEGVEKETSKHNLNSFERPISPRWSDNKDNLRRSSWESASRTQDGNMIGLTDGWCTMPSRTGRDGDVGGQTDGWGSPFDMTEGNGGMNRQNDGLGLALSVRNGNSYMDRQTDGWGTALNETDLDSCFERYAEGWDTTVTKIDGVGNMNKHADGWGTAFKKTDGLDTDLSKSDGWGASISPGCDTWRRDNPAASPSGGWSRSHRTRSRSPDHGLKHGSDGWDRRDRSGRIGAGDSALLCRHYASGICRRDSQVRFLHDDRGQVDPDASPSDFRVSGFKKGRYSRHDDREKFADSWKQRDHLEDRFSCRDVDLFDADYEKHVQRHGSHYYDVLEKQGRSHGHQYDGDYKKHVQRHGSFHDDNCARLSLRHRGHYSDKHVSDERHRMGSRHSIHCYAFTKGRCQRSLASRFVHDASYDGGCLMNDDAKEKIHDRRVAHTSFRQRPEHHRTSDCSCNYSAEGHCCHGDCNLCCQSMPNRRSEGKPYDDRWSDNLDTNKCSSWNGPNWGDHDIDNGSSCNGRKWGGRTTTMDASVSSLFRDDKHDTRHIDSVDTEGSIQKPQFTQSPQEAAQTDLPLQEMNNMLTTNSILGQSLSQGQHDENLEPQPLQELSCSVSMQNQQITPPLSSTHQVELASNAEDSNFTRENQQRHPLTPIWQQQQNVNPGNQNMESLPELLHVNGHSQEITHLPTPSGSVAPQSSINAPKHNSNEQNHQAHFQHFSNTQNTAEESRSESEKTVLGRSQVIFDTFFTEVVPGAQVTQMRNIPASLLYGNGQQLPQHHTRFNPTNAPRFAPSRPLFDHHSETPSAPVMSDSCDLPHELSLKSVEKKDQTKEELNTNLKSLAPLSVSVESDRGKPNKDSGLEDQQRQENHGSTLVQLSGLLKSKEVKETETGPKSRAPQSRQLEDLNTAVHTDGVVKISKDDKGLKMFKFALVEFVKDLLKPTWKEGSLSKEAYKTIVKKVAEKVTGTLHGPNIPNTKERIDIYLSFAKSKIEKLVQAYAERYVKTPSLREPSGRRSQNQRRR